MSDGGHNVEMSYDDLVAAVRRHPRVVDSMIAALVAGICALILTGRTGATVTRASALDWTWVVLVAVPLIWRRRAPVLVFWTVVALFWTSLGIGVQSPAGVLVPLTALHAVARYRAPSWTLPAICFLLPPGFAARVDRSASWTSLLALAAVSVTVAVIGMNQRTRQVYLAALEERADRLERERDQQARLAVAEERTRIAREMHDMVAHHLTVMTALSEGAAATVPADPGRAAGVMTLVSATGRQALAEMRRLVGVLRAPGPPSNSGAPAADLVPQPGFDDLDGLVEAVRAAGLRVTVTRSGGPGRWGPGAGLVVYRIVQEALTNTLKHAGPAAWAEVGLRFEAGRVDIDVRDDGAGRAASPGERAGRAGRHGITGMIERAATYGGEVTAGPRAGRPGWEVHARLRFDDVEQVPAPIERAGARQAPTESRRP